MSKKYVLFFAMLGSICLMVSNFACHVERDDDKKSSRSDITIINGDTLTGTNICTSDDPGCCINGEMFGTDFALPWAGEWQTSFNTSCCAGSQDYFSIPLQGHDFSDGNRVRCNPSDTLLTTGHCEYSIQALDNLFTCVMTDGSTYQTEWAPCGNSVSGYYNPLPSGSPHSYFDWDDGNGLSDCTWTYNERVINNGGTTIREPYFDVACW